MSTPLLDIAKLTPGARRVLDAASDLFYERGIHAVGVDTIAEVAGVTKKTLYDRFGSKEALVVAYLQNRDIRWRTHLDAHLAGVPARGFDRVLAVYDAALSWTGDHSYKGCSAINARAEIGQGNDSHPVFLEVARQKAWLLELFVSLCREAGVADPVVAGEKLMLLYEGAIVTIGMETFTRSFELAREVAESLLGASPAEQPRD